MRTLLARAAVLLASGLLICVTDAAAVTPISSCPMTLSTSGLYRLTANLVALDDCLSVAADSVTIDLNGFEIVGTGRGTAIQDAGAHTSIVIRDGAIRDFEKAIRIDSSSHGTVDGMIVSRNVSGILLGNNSTIKNSTIYLHSINGAALGDYGRVLGNTIFLTSFGIYSGHHTTISGNAVTRTGYGVFTGDHSTVKDNAIAVSDQSGIVGGLDNLITGNTVIESLDRGIVVAGGSSVKQNVVHSSGNSGIIVGPDSVVAGNTSLSNGGSGSGNGIEVVCPSTVKDNTALHNSGTNLSETGAGCVNTNNNAP